MLGSPAAAWGHFIAHRLCPQGKADVASELAEGSRNDPESAWRPLNLTLMRDNETEVEWWEVRSDRSGRAGDPGWGWSGTPCSEPDRVWTHAIRGLVLDVDRPRHKYQIFFSEKSNDGSCVCRQNHIFIRISQSDLVMTRSRHWVIDK